MNLIIHNTPPRYRAYLLRLWEERSQPPDSSSTWRFSLEDPRTGERRGFASLEALLVFLETQIRSGEVIPEHIECKSND